MWRFCSPVRRLSSGCSKDPEVAKREYLSSGDAYVEQKKYAEAIVEYRNAIQQDPKFGQARYKLAEAYMHDSGSLPRRTANTFAPRT